ncbi:MAG: hypothetical protein M3350_05165 [Actinomycetota bacterium]|nr:hypothetical protein [Actinomycetota bacterium]
MMQTVMAADPPTGARGPSSWGLEEGDEIAPGRSVLSESLPGGTPAPLRELMESS